LDHLSARKAPVEYFTKTIHIVQRHSPKLRLVEEFPRIERSMDPFSLSLDDIKHAYNITTSKEDPMRKLCIKILCLRRQLHEVLSDSKVTTLCKEGGHAADDIMEACAHMAPELAHKVELVEIGMH
jgi:hypothetical protein